MSVSANSSQRSLDMPSDGKFSDDSLNSSIVTYEKTSISGKKLLAKRPVKRGSFLRFSDQQLTKESRVGKKISELTTKRVIILVLIMIVILPWFSTNFWWDQILSYEMGVKQLRSFSKNIIAKPSLYHKQDLTDILDEFVKENKNLKRFPLIFVTCPLLNYTFVGNAKSEDLRKNEQKFFRLEYVDHESKKVIEGIIDIRTANKTDAIINIVRTIYISIILVIGALLFSKDVNDLCLRPIERMIDKVNQIAKNPLAIPEDNSLQEKENLQYETAIIENAISKIGRLLAVGFGEAGGEIIAQNIAKGGDVNPMIPGTKKFAVFGFCDIRNFTDTTEVLQEEVMTFVNRIGDVVHRTVEKYAGSANKNIGDAFLLVWKIPEEFVDLNSEGNIKSNHYIKNICDLALISFLKIIIKINFKPNIMKYRKNRKLNQRIPNYSVKMGFGLHLGWAIEGAIGSFYKIDASYLSPNVNMAARLEAATKQFGVTLLFSSKIFENLSKRLRNLSRQVDVVTVKGSIEPIGLYTCDLNIGAIPPAIPRKKKSITNDDIKTRKIEIINKFLLNKGKANSLIDRKSNLLTALMTRNEEFQKTFSESIEDYISGKWSHAKEKLKYCIMLQPKDGPTLNLMNYMKQFEFLAPRNWSGFRELTEK